MLLVGRVPARAAAMIRSCSGSVSSIASHHQVISTCSTSWPISAWPSSW